MRLFHSLTSPFVRKVMVLLHETGQLADVTLVAAAGSPVDTAAMPLADNPLGKVPTLTRTDGPALYDSRVICRYLDARAGGVLYPDAPQLWECLTLESLADGLMDAAVLMVYETRIRPEDRRYAPWVDAQWAKVSRALDAAESGWLPHLAGPLDMGQIAMGCALGYLDLRHSDRDWRRSRPGLAGWDADFARRPAMQATQPPAA